MSSKVTKVHEKYFKILEDYFGLYYEKMREKKQTSIKATNEALKAYSEKIAESVCDTFLEEINNLDWNGVKEAIRQQRGTKALIEAPTETMKSVKTAKRISLYADSIVFSKSYTRYKKVYKSWTPHARLFKLMFDSLSLLELKELFLADVTPPIIVLTEPVAFSTPKMFDAYKELVPSDSLSIFSDIFGRKFNAMNEVRKFVLGHKTLDRLSTGLEMSKFFIGSPRSSSHRYDFKRGVEEYMKTYLKAKAGKYGGLNDPDLLVDAVVAEVEGNIGVTNAQLLDCGFLEANPVTGGIIDWRYLVWKLSHDSRFLSGRFELGGVSRDSLVMNALSLDNFRWLGNVPINGIVRMREEGELQNLRDILSRGVKEIETVNDEDFVQVTNEVSYNFSQVFKRHRTQVKRLDEKFKRKYHFDVASLLVTGAISVSSALFPPLAMVAGIIGGGSITKIIHDILEERSKRTELKRKPTGLLFEAYEDATTKRTPEAFLKKCPKCTKETP